MTANLNSDLVDTNFLSVVSYNMHGFYQGLPVVQELIKNVSDRPDIFLLQEHLLTPANMHKIDDYFYDYFSFGCSAMSKCVESGVLVGRPFGGVISIIAARYRDYLLSRTLYCY